ncbi:hypothetical protein HMPREF1008_01743 [Olsenella sp. oral taxon 809 str. F0356]|nr:hypothetical protein HMPREF1008_01743 [Olsenella sp. oral taxon 809 str. F0356]
MRALACVWVVSFHVSTRRSAKRSPNEQGDNVGLNDMTRRSALKLLLGAGASATVAGLLNVTSAFADTASDLEQTKQDLSAAQERYDQVQAQLDQIASEYEALSREQSKTLDQIEGVNDQIDKTQEQIDKTQADLDKKKERLGERINSAYKSGNTDFLSIIMNSASFGELTSNLYYMGKITEADERMIQEVKDAKAALDQQKAELEGQRAELEALNETQRQQLAQMQSKQEEVQGVLAGLDQDVKDLIAKRDAEIQEMAEEKARQEAAAEAARKAAAAAASSSAGGGASSNVSGSLGADGATTGSQARVLAACQSTPSPGAGLCAMWVSQVFSNAGYAYAGGNANDMYNAWCTSSNLGQLKPGMIVAVSSHPHTSAGRIYGHIGIYVGNGTIMDNVGYVRTGSLSEWISYYGGTVTPRWGWLMGIVLA